MPRRAGVVFEPGDLEKFVSESNRIEDIHRPPTEGELLASAHFLALDRPRVADLCEFVQTHQPDAELRVEYGMNVFIGDHVPPRGGPEIEPALAALLGAIAAGELNPFAAHVAYETLHPFSDGNGRSGRILWAWQMVRQGWHPRKGIGFLHSFYYQTLSAQRAPG